MCRESTHSSRTQRFLPSPAPDQLNDPERELYAMIETKRREIDTEIQAFVSRKEQEFRHFEDELRSRKRRNTNWITNLGLPPTSSPMSVLTDPSNGSLASEKTKKADDMHLAGLKSSLGPSKPSVSVDRVTISGLTTPPVYGTPPPLGGHLSRSPTHASGPPSRKFAGYESGKSPKETDFHGIFTPSYLQLLTPKPSPLPHHSTSQSLTDSPSQPIHESPCALAAPKRPPNSLPSALRSANGGLRKRKHVTFRLTHSVVVDPSSSYEESPSPSDQQDEDDLYDRRADFSVEMAQNFLPVAGLGCDRSGGLTSPNKDVDDSNFFSFDEELEDTGGELNDFENVSVRAHWSLPLYYLTSL